MATVEGPPFKIDHRYDGDELAQFAAQMEHVSPEKQQWFEAVLNGTESLEFYKGLLAGYAGIIALMRQMPLTEFVVNLEQMCSFLASEIRKRHALGDN